MKNAETPLEKKQRHSSLGFYSSIVTAVLSVITLALAVTTPPLSGPFCTGSCFEYPYLDIAERFPRDYYWMYPAIVLSCTYLIMMLSLYHTATNRKKVYSLVGSAFAMMSALLLSVDYFVQVTVIPPSTLAGETDGLSLLTQFNPHGLFIALEEIGYLFLVLSFIFIIPLFEGKKALEKSVRWISIIGLLLTVITFALITAEFGIEREYRFEVGIISIAYLELIPLSILLARYFGRRQVHS
ncbi:MAG TPA: hypothetical protein VFP20_07250 [Bacteroidales bacterium]|nr:hypothetical protein [Bacteroidales bacterium]